MRRCDAAYRELSHLGSGWLRFSTRELELLNSIAGGKSAFERDTLPDFDEVDAYLQAFVELGYVDKIVRTHYADDDFPRRADVIGGLTRAGQDRRRELAGELEEKAAGLSVAA